MPILEGRNIEMPTPVGQIVLGAMRTAREREAEWGRLAAVREQALQQSMRQTMQDLRVGRAAERRDALDWQKSLRSMLESNARIAKDNAERNASLPGSWTPLPGGSPAEQVSRGMGSMEPPLPIDPEMPAADTGEETMPFTPAAEWTKADGSVFGMVPDGAGGWKHDPNDKTDAHVKGFSATTGKYGFPIKDPGLKGAALSPEQLRAAGIDWNDTKQVGQHEVEVMGADGKPRRYPIVDALGTKGRVDFTASAYAELGGPQNKNGGIIPGLQYRIVPKATAGAPGTASEVTPTRNAAGGLDEVVDGRATGNAMVPDGRGGFFIRPKSGERPSVAELGERFGGLPPTSIQRINSAGATGGRKAALRQADVELQTAARAEQRGGNARLQFKVTQDGTPIAFNPLTGESLPIEGLPEGVKFGRAPAAPTVRGGPLAESGSGNLWQQRSDGKWIAPDGSISDTAPADVAKVGTAPKPDAPTSLTPAEAAYVGKYGPVVDRMTQAEAVLKKAELDASTNWASIQAAVKDGKITEQEAKMAGDSITAFWNVKGQPKKRGALQSDFDEARAKVATLRKKGAPAETGESDAMPTKRPVRETGSGARPYTLDGDQISFDKTDLLGSVQAALRDGLIAEDKAREFLEKAGFKRKTR